MTACNEARGAAVIPLHGAAGNRVEGTVERRGVGVGAPAAPVHLSAAQKKALLVLCHGEAVFYPDSDKWLAFDPAGQRYIRMHRGTLLALSGRGFVEWRDGDPETIVVTDAGREAVRRV